MVPGVGYAAPWEVAERKYDIDVQALRRSR
jgi:hypothetical protein